MKKVLFATLFTLAIAAIAGAQTPEKKDTTLVHSHKETVIKKPAVRSKRVATRSMRVATKTTTTTPQ